MRRYRSIYLPLLFLVYLVFSCKKDPLTDSSFRLGFSTDTLSFDTVFVTLGSTTLNFTVRNNEDRPVVISQIELEGRGASRFRINVDGESLPDGLTTDITIPPKDSIYIFVEVTVDPNDESLPFLLQDRVLFLTNGSEQQVVLQAYGQNAHFINGEEIETQEWIDDLPYVVLNSMLVKECHTLTIRKGVSVYFGGNSGMFVAGNLIVEGEKDSMVTFRGVRLDDIAEDISYDEIPGQWRGIFLLRSDACNIASTISYADIRNAQFGISMGSTTLEDIPSVTIDNGPELNIENSIIRNHSVFGIYGFLSTIEARNVLAYKAGQQLLAFQLGGSYSFEHCTFYNQGSEFLEHQDELLFFSNYFADPGNGLILEADLQQLNFTNSILYGTLLDEIYPDSLEDSQAELNYMFDHCLIKSRLDFGTNAQDCIFNVSPLFTDISEEDYHLSESSACIAAGNSSTAGTTDLDQVVRDAEPDIGAYEFVP